MKTAVTFYKENDTWYADVPNHTKDENEMIMGSEIALDFIAKDKTKVTLELSDEMSFGYIYHFTITEHDDDGAYYQLQGNCDLLEPIWICNVTHDVFGEHPNDIYLLNIKVE